MNIGLYCHPEAWSSLNWMDRLVFLGGVHKFVKIFTGLDWTSPVIQWSGPVWTGLDQTSPVIQWSGPVLTGRTDWSDWRRLSFVHPNLSKVFTGPDQTSPVGRTGPIDGVFLGGFIHIFKIFLLDHTRLVQWSSGPVQFELDWTGPVQWSIGLVHIPS